MQRQTAQNTLDRRNILNWRDDPRCAEVRRLNAPGRVERCEDAVVMCRAAFHEAEEEERCVRDAVLLGRATDADVDAARKAMRTAAEALDETTRDLDHAKRQEDTGRARIEAVDDDVRAEYNQTYQTIYREIVEAMAVKFRDLTPLNAELRRVAELVGGTVNLPVFPWAELDFSDKPTHVDYQSRLSFWLREAREAGYSV